MGVLEGMSVASSAAQAHPVDEQAVKSIAQAEFFAFLGEEKVRKVAEACERVESAELVNRGRWLNPATRKEILLILGKELPQISETYAWMVARRYRDLKRYYKEQVELAEKKKREEEAKAKLLAEKAAKAAAAKAAAAKTAPAAASAASPAPAAPTPGAGEPPKPSS